MSTWNTDKWIVFLLPLGLLLLGMIVWVFLRNTFRTRLRMDKQLHADPDIPEWLVVFNWSRKVLYVPSVAASFLAAGVTALKAQCGWDWPNDYAVGGIWLGVFILNFLIDEYEITFKILLITLLVGVAAFLWLMYLGWFMPFIESFGNLKIQFSAVGYLMLGLILLLAIVTSWIKGLFFYVSITPNYLNMQGGPTETGEQISREDYNTRVDTSDFLERVLGFGRLVMTFRDHSRPPLVILVANVGKKARRLESLRGIIAVDRPRAGSDSPMTP